MLRIDATKRKLNWEQLPSGAIHIHSVLGVADLPLVYYDLLGNKRVETITEEQLFNEDSLKSASGLPITLGHPSKGLYNNNEENLLIGHTLTNFIKDDATLSIESVIDDERGIRLITDCVKNDKIPEVSPAYFISNTKLRADGIYEQVERVYNHQALLSFGEGRGGDKVILRLDSLVEEPMKKYFILGKEPMKIRIDGKDWEHEESIQSQVGILENKVNGLDIEKKNLQLQLDSIISEKNRILGEKEALSIKIDELSKAPNTEDVIAEQIQERVDCWNAVLPIFRKDHADFQPDYKMSAFAIKTTFLKHKHPSINLDGKDENYINGLWDGLNPTIEEAKKETDISRTDSMLEILNKQTITSIDSTREDGKAEVDRKRQAQKDRIKNNGLVKR